MYNTTLHHMYTVGLDKKKIINFNLRFYTTKKESKELEIIFGSLLGDGKLELAPRAKNVRFGFTQGKKNEEYFIFVFNELKYWCKISNYRIYTYFDKRTNKNYTSLNFWSKNLEIFNFFYKIFYSNNKKIVPKDLSLLTPLALSHWIMQDGSRGTSKGLYICTDNFKYEEVLYLSNYLSKTYNIKTSIHKMKKYYRIYINVKSLDILRPLILPYFHSSMYYKILN